MVGDVTPFDLEIWARTGWAEARGDGSEGIRGVIHAVYNRYRAKKWFSGATIAETCLFPLQFSCWNDTDPNRRAIARVADDDDALAICRAMVQRVLDGDDDPTFGSTHYYSTTMKEPPKWAASGQMVVQIGKHKFFKGVA